MVRRLGAVALLGAMFLAPTIVRAQEHTSASSITFGGWAGVAHRSPTGIFAATPKREVRLASLRLTHTIAHGTHFALDHVIDVVPVAVVSGPPLVWRSKNAPPVCPDAGCTTGETIQRDPIYGFGLAPLGFQLRLRPVARVQPFAAFDAGGLWFAQPMPISPAGRFNFMADVGAGVIARLSGHVGVLAGYKFLHISNGGTAKINPGVDNHMLYLGLLHLPHP